MTHSEGRSTRPRGDAAPSHLFGCPHPIGLYIGLLLAILAVFIISSPGTAPLAVAKQPSSTRSVLIPSLSSGLYKPKRFCPSNHTCFTNARWTSWGRVARARALGTTSYPGGSNGAKRGVARVTMWRVQNVCGGKRYTRAKWQYRGEMRSTRSFFLPLGSCGYWTGA